MSISSETAMPDSVFEGLDRVGPMPLYSQIAERIEKVIVDGTVPVESWIENEIALAARLRTSRATTRRALEELVGRGLLQRRRGRGTQVVSGSVSRPVALTSLHDDLRQQGRTPGTRVLSREILAAEGDVASALRVEPGTEVVRLRRLRTVDGAPLAVLTNWLPADPAFSLSDLEQHGLYELLRFGGAVFRTARQSIGARTADRVESDALGLPPGSKVLTMRRVVSNPGGHVVDFGQHCYHPDNYSFEMTLTGK